MKEFTVLLPRRARKLLRRTPFFEGATMAGKRYFAWRRRGCVQGRVDEFIRGGCPLVRVEIETFNSCQNDCGFCPVSAKNDIRKKEYMGDDLFSSIINQLAEMQYSEGLYLSSNNEPLLDYQMPERCEEARALCPNAFIGLYTNGLLLRERMFHEMMQWVDFLVIDNYEDSLRLIKPVAECLRYATEEEAAKVVLEMRYKDDIIDTRGGFSPTRTRSQVLDISCTNIFSEAVIVPSGDISVCCQDVYNQHPMGSLKHQKLKEIWHGDGFKNMRQKFLASGRSCLPMCSACDFVRWDPDTRRDIANLSTAKMTLEEIERRIGETC